MTSRENSVVTELFRVLLLEDDPVLNWGLAQHIERTFPNVKILRAENVHDAMQFIDDDRTAPDVAIQDIRVPLRDGEAAVASTEVTDRLKELEVRSIFMTSYSSSEDVKQFVQSVKLTEPQMSIILKNEVGALKDSVLQQLRDLFVSLASRRVNERLTRLFHTSEPLTNQHNSTASLLTLNHQIARYWDYFNTPTKERLRERFDIELTEQGVENVRLAPSGPSQ